jgi:hypothetical protein
MQDIFDSMPWSTVALAKIKPTDPNFRLYSAGWVGDYATTDTMEVTGAVFREAKSGPRKGQLCILVPGTKRTAYITEAEMKAAEARAISETKKEQSHVQ